MIPTHNVQTKTKVQFNLIFDTPSKYWENHICFDLPQRHLIWIPFSQEQIETKKTYFDRMYSVKFSALQMQADSEKQKKKIQICHRWSVLVLSIFESNPIAQTSSQKHLVRQRHQFLKRYMLVQKIERGRTKPNTNQIQKAVQEKSLQVSLLGISYMKGLVQ